MICQSCGKKEAQVKIPYMKRELCGICFSKLFERRVRRTIRKHGLIQKKDKKVGLALSGGENSMVLLWILNKLSKKAPHSELIAISVVEKDKKEEIAKKFCQELGVRHYLIPLKKKSSRKELLNKKAWELKIDKLAFGYDLDEISLAFLVNFFKGDFKKISELSPLVTKQNENFVPEIKPLRECLKVEIVHYAQINKIPFSEKKVYSMDTFYGEAKKVLERIEEKHPGTKFQLLSSLDDLIDLISLTKKN